MKRTIEKNANLQFSMSEMEDKNNDLMANVEKLKKEVDINKNEITKFISILPLNKAADSSTIEKGLSLLFTGIGYTKDEINAIRNLRGGGTGKRATDKPKHA